MDTNKLVVVELLDKSEVVFFDEDFVSCLDQGVVKCLNKNNKDYFDVDFILPHPLKQIIEETLGGQCMVHHGLPSQYLRRT